MTYANKKRKDIPTKSKMRNYFLVEVSERVAVYGCFLLIALLCVHYESAEGVVIDSPKNATVIVNHSTFFNCSISTNKSNEPIWYHHPLDGNGKREDVYDYKKIKDKYQDRFSIDKNLTSGTFNLLVQRPEPTDAGRYECVEDVEKDTGPSAELTVLDSNLVCESDKDLNEVVGPTECTNPIAPDQLQLSCSVTYSGNFPPQMEWRKVGSELQSNETKCDVRGNRVMCNATLEANFNMDGSVYICQIITAEQYNCSLKINKTLYTFSDTSVRAVTTTEEVFCSANTSKDLPCSYKWYKDNKTEQSGQTLKPSNPGKYRCETECKIRDETCAFTVTVINVSESETSRAGLIAGVIVALFVIVAIIAIVVWRQYKKWKKKNHQLRAVELTTAGLLQETDATDGKDENLQKKMNENGSSPQVSADLVVAVDPRDADHSEVPVEDDIQKALGKADYIDKGLNGEIYGPGHWQYKGIVVQCAFERIMCSTDQQTAAEEGETTKEQKIYNKGQEWMALSHHNLITFYDVVLLRQAVYIAMEYATGGSVRKALKKCKEDLPLTVVLDWAKQIAQGMEYLHGKGIVHRSLKCAEILVMDPFDPPTAAPVTLKVASYNLACEVDKSIPVTFQGMFAWMAPEAISEGNHSKNSDIWSYGVAVWEIITRGIPYDGEKVGKIIKGIPSGELSLPIPDSCPKDLRDIFTECFAMEPTNRPAFREILTRLR